MGIESIQSMALDISISTYIVLGILVSWSKYGREKLRIYFLSNILDIFDSESGKARQLVELIIFVLVGYIISAGIVVPTTPIQALTAGFGWTGILTTLNSKELK